MTMQKVAWPTTIVQSEKVVNGQRAQKVKNELSAIPVMIPGSAIGRTSRNETASRPKKRKRWTAKAAALPRRSAMIVAAVAALIESTKAARASVLCHVDANHFVERPEIGQLWMFEGLKA